MHGMAWRFTRVLCVRTIPQTHTQKQNPATYREQGRVVRVPAADLLRAAAPALQAFSSMRCVDFVDVWCICRGVSCPHNLP